MTKKMRNIMRCVICVSAMAFIFVLGISYISMTLPGGILEEHCWGVPLYITMGIYGAVSAIIGAMCRHWWNRHK